jgi:hypothetical protein
MVAVALAIALTIASGMLHGRMSQRWGVDERMKAAAERLALLPEQIGDWKQESTSELGRSAIELLSCQGYIQRGYRHQQTGEFIKLAVMIGPGAKMSIHVPEICYEASNFTLLGARERLELHVADQDHAFWQVKFQLNDVSQRKLHVVYGWSDGGPWLAPRFPRWSVAGRPVLYKLQLSHVVRDSPAETDAADEDAVRSFLTQAVTALAERLPEATQRE